VAHAAGDIARVRERPWAGVRVHRRGSRGRRWSAGGIERQTWCEESADRKAELRRGAANSRAVHRNRGRRYVQTPVSQMARWQRGPSDGADGHCQGRSGGEDADGRHDDSGAHEAGSTDGKDRSPLDGRHTARQLSRTLRQSEPVVTSRTAVPR